MDLEGTRHEKAVLIVIAFIIGFTCGLIAFGLQPKNKDIATYEAPILSPAVLQATPLGVNNYTPPTENPPEYIEAIEPTNNEAVSYEEGKLYARVGDERFLLSLRTDIMAGSNVEGFATQGLHEALPAYSSSDSGAYVFFCEQQTPTATCTSFVFDTTTNTIHFINYNADKVIVPNTEASAATWEGDSLNIGGYRSADQTKPWVMVSKTAN